MCDTLEQQRAQCLPLTLGKQQLDLKVTNDDCFQHRMPGDISLKHHPSKQTPFLERLTR